MIGWVLDASPDLAMRGLRSAAAFERRSATRPDARPQLGDKRHASVHEWHGANYSKFMR